MAQTTFFFFFLFILPEVQNESELKLLLKQVKLGVSYSQQQCTLLGNQLFHFHTRDKEEDVQMQSLKINTHTHPLMLSYPSKLHYCEGET